MANIRLIGAVIAVALLTAALAHLWHSQLSAPDGAIDTGFSEEHAYATLSKIWAEQKPHSAGSPENAVVRDRIVEELKASGYQPEVQAAVECGPPERNPGCTAVENIIAVHKGAGRGKAVLATGHYDSVPAGPGVSDDGAGAVSVMELARFFADKQTKNDIIFLITDGEETGLRGAIAFAKHHALMAHVGVVVNVEARGASGPSMMFETGVGNSKLMELFAGAVARPSANSVTYEVYRLLPNDTDFTVYRKMGLTGFNFAYSNSASLYHSGRDNLQYISRNSLQHHGEHAFAVTRVLADTDLETLKSTSDASYFDVFGQTTVIWPAALNLPLALFALVAILGLIVMHRAAFTLGGTLWSVGAFLAVPLLLFAVGWLLSFPLGIWPGAHPIDHPFPWPGRIAILTAALLVALVIAAAMRGRAEMRALLLVNWLVIALIATAAAYGVTGASFPLLWPAVAFAVAGWAETLMRRRLGVAGWIGFAGIAFFLLNFVLALELVLSFSLTQYKILVLFPVVMALVPLLVACLAETSAPAWFLSGVSAAIVAGAAAIASQTPAYAADHPRGLNVVYYDDKNAKPRWLIGFIGAPDENYLRSQGFPAQDEPFKPLGVLTEDHARFKPAADQQLRPPTLTLRLGEMRDGLVTLHTELHAGRSGFVMGIGFAAHSGVRSVRYEGQELIAKEKIEGNDPVTTRFWGLRDVPLDIAYDPASKPKVTLYELSPLTESQEGSVLTTGRPANATTAYRGDCATVFTTVDLAGLKAP
jgi:hypothetical protein